MRMSKIRHQYAIFYAILTPSGKFPRRFLTFRRHLPVTKANVFLTFCTYKVVYAKKAGGKNCRGNLLGGILMATMRCAKDARGHQHQRCRHGVGPQNKYSTRTPTSPFFCPTFCTAAILLASGFGFTSFCLWRFELLQSILIHRPRSKVNNELFFFVKTTSTSSV